MSLTSVSSGEINLSFWENFIESIALVLSKGLTDKETELLAQNWTALQTRLRALSNENLRKLKEESVHLRPYCKHQGKSRVEGLVALVGRLFNDIKCPQGTCSTNALRGFVKSFFVTYAVRYGLGFFPALLMGRLFKNPALLLKIGGKDTIRFSLFMSSFTTTFKAVLCGMRRWRESNDWKNAFVAGMAAGLTLYLDSNRSRRLMIALYLSTRSVHFASRWLWRHYLEPQWDPHARTREALVKEQEQTEKESTLGTGQTSRTMGGLRESSSTSSLPPAVSIPVTASSFNSSQHPLLEYYLIEEESSLSSPETAGGGSPKDVLRMMHRPTKSPGLPTSSSIKHLELHPTKAARVHFIRKFIRQSAAVFVMMLSSSQILYAYVCEPDTLARSYLSFLIVHGGVKQRCPENPLSFLNLMGDSIKAGASGFSSKFIAPPLDIFTPLPFHETVPNGLPADQMKDFAEWLCQAPNEYVLCALQHNWTTSCVKGVFSAFKDEWWRALALYGPLNTIMALLFRGKMIFKQPRKLLFQILKSVLRSTLFLTCYVTASWCSPCLFRNMFGGDKKWMYYVNGLLAGSMVLLEAPGRRLELALYCAPRAVESFWNCGVKAKWWRSIPGGELIYFSLSMGVIMSLYQHDPESIQDGYRKVMVRFLGVN